MDDPRNWLDEIVIVNESKEERLPGDVSLYRSIGDACEALEYWWVKNGEGHAFTASGVRLVLTAEDNGLVTVASREECAEGPAIVVTWLMSLAETALEARKRVAQDGRAILSAAEEAGSLPTTVDGLIAYIGLPWTAPRDWFVPGCLALLAATALLLAAILIKAF
ncbi:hypothetical protein H5J25_14015 [Sphingomonas aliaeris]|uniref:Uncharacterized protein n=1 Tax=Sphingomonas aliaeris TaxID=2759526 RepID=A0A974S3Z7_9SPHN|nr:hypothetical protein [Sphingomonas aliaeris]QQV76555.1 hypothetical protein H5J25_14015 [Sphingomonas aliaeris]